jgi:isopentenyl diphosphate isomerase/L-lactate dehydrogenase-like FMN-dependent dehydrogenase
VIDDVVKAVNLADFESLAADRMERAAFDYVAGGAGDELTLADNIAAWRRWQLLPRVLRDVSAIDTSTTWLGTAVAAPFGIAPMAFQHFAYPDAELATARAAAPAGVVFCLSTMSSRSIEEVAAAVEDVDGGRGPRWFQLYVHRDRGVSAELVRRAESAGYGAVVVTVDLPVGGRRERDIRNSLAYPQVFGNFGGPLRADEEADEAPSLAAVVGGFNDGLLSWSDLAWLRGLSDLPLVIKGILAADDARLAVEHGAAAVVVSNHGGRQLDRTPAAIDVLPDIVEAVDGRAEVYLDGGVRRGIDVLTALALGARGVFVGRPIFFALAAGGEAGVSRALQLLAAETEDDMTLLGARTIGEIGRQQVRRTRDQRGDT